MQMDPSTLPSQSDLNSLMGAWNPMAYMQGNQNQDLQSQFRQQAYNANANTIDKGTLENQLSAATQPSDIQIKANTADQGQIKSQQDALALATAQDTQSDKQALLHKQLAREMSDEDLSTESNRILNLYQQAKLNNDVDGMDKYGSAMNTLTGAIASKAADRVQAQSLRELDKVTQMGVARIHAGATTDAATIAANSREAVGAQHSAAVVQAAQLKQGLNAKLAQLEGMDQNNPDVARQTAKVRQDLASANAAYSNAINLEALTGGAITRQGPNTPAAPNLSDDDLVNKYLKK